MTKSSAVRIVTACGELLAEMFPTALAYHWMVVLVAAFFDFVKALPAAVPDSASLVRWAGDVLPGYELGFG